MYTTELAGSIFQFINIMYQYDSYFMKLNYAPGTDMLRGASVQLYFATKRSGSQWQTCLFFRLQEELTSLG